MRLIGLAWRWLWSRPAVTALNLLMLALGFGAITLLTLVSQQLEAQARRDLAGIDLVVGAKGSPLQLILAGVFHIDAPPGNIAVAAVQALREHPLVAEVIPVSVGDSVQGYRIVGTSAALPALYGVALRGGRWWGQPLEAVLGDDVARRTSMPVGAVFAGSHGLGGGGASHGDRPYRVVGVLARCACVLDRLVLTATESVWAVHESDAALDEDDRRALEAEREVSLALVRYRTPLAAVTLPRWVQAQPGLQAAVPAVESARLFRLLGVGLDVLRGMGAMLLAVAGFSVLIALLHAVRERRADLAMMRMLGAPPWRVAAVLVAEALMLVLLGLAIGLVLGHGLTEAVGLLLRADRSLEITGWTWGADHAGLLAGAVVMAVLAVAWPAWRALTLDVAAGLQAA